MPLIFSFFGLGLSYILFYKINIKFIIKKYIYEFFFNAGYFNIIYNKFYLYFLHLCYSINVKNIEKGILEWIGPIGIYLFFRKISYTVRLCSPYLLNIALLIILLNIIWVLYCIIFNNILFINNIYYILLIYYIIK